MNVYRLNRLVKCNYSRPKGTVLLRPGTVMPTASQLSKVKAEKSKTLTWHFRRLPGIPAGDETIPATEPGRTSHRHLIPLKDICRRIASLNLVKISFCLSYRYSLVSIWSCVRSSKLPSAVGTFLFLWHHRAVPLQVMSLKNAILYLYSFTVHVAIIHCSKPNSCTLF
jgi:hypothetical protein